jgi:lipopolysaccharide export system protein LptA
MVLTASKNLFSLCGFAIMAFSLAAPAHAQQVIPGQAPAYAKKEATTAKPETPALATAATPAAQQKKPVIGKSGDQQIDITADNSLEWNEHDRIYTAKGHAKAVRGDVTIEADILKAYDRKKSDDSSEVWKLTAEGHVRIIGKDSAASGDAGVYDIDTRKAILTGKDLQLKTPTDHVTAEQSLEFWEIEQLAIARGNAKASREGREVRADELVAHLKTNAKGEQDIDSLEAKGNVHIVTAEDVIFCDMVNYSLAQNTATLTGNVSITRGKNQLRGERVETDFKTGKSRLLAGKKGRVHALISAAKGKPSKTAQPPEAAGDSNRFFMR